MIRVDNSLYGKWQIPYDLTKWHDHTLRAMVLACGGGILLEGNQDQWKVIKYPDNGDNFTQMVVFKNTIYVSTQFAMYKLVEGKLEECIPAKQNSDICLTVSSLSFRE